MNIRTEQVLTDMKIEREERRFDFHDIELAINLTCNNTALLRNMQNCIVSPDHLCIYWGGRGCALRKEVRRLTSSCMLQHQKQVRQNYHSVWHPFMPIWFTITYSISPVRRSKRAICWTLWSTRFLKCQPINHLLKACIKRKNKKQEIR